MVNGDAEPVVVPLPVVAPETTIIKPLLTELVILTVIAWFLGQVNADE